MTDNLGIGEETPRERLARENMEGDLRFLAELRALGEALGASSRVKKSLARHGDDPRLSDIRRYAHALGISIAHDCTQRVDSSFDEFAAEKKAEWDEDATRVYKEASQDFETAVFTSEDFAEWRKKAQMKAEADERQSNRVHRERRGRDRADE